MDATDQEKTSGEAASLDPTGKIAIVGMALRVPGASTPEQLLHNLREGVESIHTFTPEELAAAGVPREAREDERYVPRRGTVAGVRDFDAGLFGYAPREAALIDPQQRLFLECAWEALERAGCDPGRYGGSIGVYAGVAMSSYLLENLLADPELFRGGGYQALMGNSQDFLATRVSYKLNLNGPSIAVQTACSTSLVAVHLAMQSLLHGECDVALAGGVSVEPQPTGYRFQEGGILSPDGHCRAFDERAQGTVPSSGVAVVVLKPLATALADGDTIHAVLLGSAANNDGADKVGYTAPSSNGQARVIAEALAVAGVEPHTVGYVEAHGTGTSMGDPVEVAALNRVYGGAGALAGSCALGSLKSNLGHLDAAAGVAGLIKATLSLEHAVLFPSLHFVRPNPGIDFAAGPFYVNTTCREWTLQNGPRRAAVSSFGVGGTNVHVVLEEAPARSSGASPHEVQALCVSARTATARDTLVAQVAAHLGRGGELADAAYTLQSGRAVLPHRRALLCASGAEATQALADPSRNVVDESEERDRPLAFLFPGQGAQYAGMGARHYDCEPAFRATVDRCAVLLQPLLGLDIRTLLYPAPEQRDAAEARLKETAFTQPALFVTEYALAHLWQQRGVKPCALMGHSLGEYVAACVAGVFSLEDALSLVVTRARLMQALAPGAMLAVTLAEAELRARLPEGVSIAAVNGPALVVASGPGPAIVALAADLERDGIKTRPLATSHAFHSAMMEPMLAAFEAELLSVRLSPPQIPVISNVSGQRLRDSEAVDPGYWLRHLRSTVRWVEGIDTLAKDGRVAFLEVGPGNAFTTLLRMNDGQRRATASLPSRNRSHEEALVAARAVGCLWVWGVPFDVAAYHQTPRLRVPLPTYPFERKPCWVQPASSRQETETVMEQSQPAQAKVTVPPPAERRPRLERELQELFARLLGIEAREVEPEHSFFQLGAESLLLLQASQDIEQRYGLRVPFRQLLEDLSSVAQLAAHLDAQLPEDPVPVAAPVPAAAAAAVAAAPLLPPEVAPGSPGPFVGEGGLDQIVMSQLALMSRQLDLLKGSGSPLLATLGAAAAPAALAPAAVAPAAAAPVAATMAPRAPSPGRTASAAKVDPTAHPARAAHLRALVAAVNAKTPGSQQAADRFRAVMADSRAIAGFSSLTKEMCYPLVAGRGVGAHLFDVDGNEYVDVAMGFGSLLFGHTPAFLQRALHEQLADGLQIGGQSRLAGEVAALVSELTGVERVAFCNSGTEAVMSALRVARAVTRRQRVALFTHSYHGSFDGTLVRPEVSATGLVAKPLALGVAQGLLPDILLLDPDDPRCLDLLAQKADELAAVLVEPIRSRAPEGDPRAFLQALREVTSKAGAALIFDEVVTGFRMHPGGGQALFDVRADLVAYGKAVGAGLPIGMLAGRAAFMNAVDGGPWRYGDGSSPLADTTFYSGTFFKHPLTMAGVRAALLELRARGPELQRTLGRTAETLVGRLNRTMEELGVDVRVVRAGSLFRFLLPSGGRELDLFYYEMLCRGVYVAENRTCFLSTEHGEADLERIVEAARGAAQAMREATWFEDKRPATSIATTEPRRVPLSEAQRQLWIAAEQVGEAGRRLWNEALILHLHGDLDVLALQRAVGELGKRHEALRTTFDIDGEHQLIQPSVPLDAPMVDFSGASQPEAEVRRFIRAEGERPFDLQQGPVVRAHILRQAQDHHVLAMFYSHLAIDGWSTGIILGELAELYLAAHTGTPPQLGEAMPYRRFVEEERRALDGEAGQRAEAFWLAECAPPRPSLRLPGQRPFLPGVERRGAYVDLALGPTLSRQLKELCVAQKSTLYVTLLSGFQALLAELTGHSDVMVGVLLAGQAFMGKPVLGHCVNLLPLRMDVAAAPFTSLLGQTRRKLAAVTAHLEYPFHKLVRRLNPPREIGRLALVPIGFNLDRIDTGLFDRLGLRTAIESPETINPRFDVFLNAVDAGDDITLHCEYDADMHDAARVSSWLDRLRELLAAAVAQPDAPLAPKVERGPASRSLAPGLFAAKPEIMCHELIVAQAAAQPHALAVKSADLSLTFGELDARSNGLAHALRARGVGRESLVGICISRSATLPLAELAVMKAGAAFVPLDPAHPDQRLHDTFRRARVPVVLTTLADRERLSLPDWEVIALDDPARPIAAAAVCPASGVTPKDRAYVIFTSGSTGQPKGVEIEHRSLSNLLRWHIEDYGVAPGERASQFAGPAFDASVQEIWSNLCGGASLILVPQEARLSVDRLVDWFSEERITLGGVPSPLLDPVLQKGLAPNACLRVLFAGGDRLHRGLPEPLGYRVSNVYGPTEVTIVATACDVTCAPGAPLIGGPISNLEAHVLDADMQPVPVGSPGELYLGGKGLARGYFDQPVQTAERFLPNPFGGAGARLYRTGDEVRQRPDGKLEFIGRLDSQVKIRGHRIELGEIEAVLMASPSVREAAVVARPEEEGGREPQIVAYVVPRGSFDEPGLRAFLRERLPVQMVPRRFVPLAALPLNINGKVDRKSLPAVPRQAPTTPVVMPEPSNLEGEVAKVWCEVLGLSELAHDQNFFDVGGHSFLMMKLHKKLISLLAIPVSIVDLFRCTTVASQAALLRQRGVQSLGLLAPVPSPAPAPTVAPAAPTLDRRIAVVGRSGRFPSAPDVNTFWSRIEAGQECITFLSDQQLEAAGVDATTRRNPAYVNAASILEGDTEFDADYFGVGPREAEAMDPQQRVFLECASAALDDAGYDPARTDKRIGVFAGTAFNSYLPRVLDDAMVGGTMSPFQVVLANDKDFVATRVAYKLNLRGPSLTVQTACSTSLSAVHVAIQNLLGNDCDMALAGGVSIDTAPPVGYTYVEGTVLSRDGHCRPYDAQASGIISANGAGVVVLKRLADALVDGDRIHAVILASAMNNDGAQKAGYTAPSVDGQAAVIREALDRAGVDAGTITYVEGHGTATPLGDPCEVAALTKAFGDSAPRNGCALGSVKGNFGHLNTAAGVAGLIKTVEALAHRVLPPTLHFQQPNPEIDFANSPFYVSAKAQPWQPQGIPRRAGVSSFGVGGTNVHLVLEEAPTPAPAGQRTDVPLLLSARSERALDLMTEQLAQHLEKQGEGGLRDVAHTLAVGRRRFRHRRAVVASTAAEAAAKLRDDQPQWRIAGQVEAGGAPAVAFMLPGTGAEYPQMARALYDSEPVYRAYIDRAHDLLSGEGLDLRAVLLPEAGQEEAAAQRLKQMATSQPLLYAVEYAMAQLWSSWGVTPAALIGYSLGEYVGAALAGVFDFEAGLRLVLERARLMQTLSPGAMLMVGLPAAEVEALLPEALDIAGINAPAATCVAGTEAAIAAFRAGLEARGVECRPLRVPRGCHSRLVEPMMAPYRKQLEKLVLRAPHIPLISNVTGAFLTEAEACDPEYWLRHLRQPVRFAEGLTTLTKGRRMVLAEVGPGRTLGNLAKQLGRPEELIVASLRHPKDPTSDVKFLRTALARMWVLGLEPRAEALSPPGAQRVPLPSYPFERKRYELTALTERETVSTAAPAPTVATAATAASLTVDALTEVLSEVFCEVLGIKGCQPHDNFFELGGDSVIALQIALRARRRGVEVSAKQVFGAQSIAALVATLAAAPEAAPAPAAEAPEEVDLSLCGLDAAGLESLALAFETGEGLQNTV